MKINRDLVDAVMMLSFISLVLVGTSDFDNSTIKDITMVLLGVLAIVMVVLRVISMKNQPEIEEE